MYGRTTTHRQTPSTIAACAALLIGELLLFWCVLLACVCVLLRCVLQQALPDRWTASHMGRASVMSRVEPSSLERVLPTHPVRRVQLYSPTTRTEERVWLSTTTRRGGTTCVVLLVSSLHRRSVPSSSCCCCCRTLATLFLIFNSPAACSRAAWTARPRRTCRTCPSSGCRTPTEPVARAPTRCSLPWWVINKNDGPVRIV